MGGAGAGGLYCGGRMYLGRSSPAMISFCVIRLSGELVVCNGNKATPEGTPSGAISSAVDCAVLFKSMMSENINEKKGKLCEIDETWCQNIKQGKFILRDGKKFISTLFFVSHN